MATARRATIFRDKLGEWRYRIQSGNWQVIATSEEGFKQKATVLKRVGKNWPGIEIVEK